jgi:AcrR family transcriptional regulator
MTRSDPPRDLRDQCVRQALEIIAAKGIEALSMREVARRMGVSHQAPYKHFASRDHILARIVATAFEEFAAHLDGRERSDDPFEELGSMGRAYFAFAERHPLKYQLMFGAKLPEHAHTPEVATKGQHAFSILQDAVARIRRCLGSHPSQEQIDLDAMFVWSTVHGMATIRQTAAQKSLGLTDRTSDVMAEHALHLIRLAFAEGARPSC